MLFMIFSLYLNILIKVITSVNGIIDTKSNEKVSYCRNKILSKNCDFSNKWNKIIDNSNINDKFNINQFEKLYNSFKFINNEKKDKNNYNFERQKYKNAIKNDKELFIKYLGNKLEPEWQWAKNISIVYTWVDGSDINFLDQKAKYDYGYRTNSNRYRSIDEIRYSLRSIQKYMPWHEGIIYIVTNNQIPVWINVTHPRIKIIDHKQIIPEHIYPTYNSNIIELFLDKIPGLTERFIYFNDDLFINNYIHPSFFFTSNTYYPKVYKRKNRLNLSENEINDFIKKNTNMFKTTNYNTRKLIQEYFDPDFQYHILCHTPFPLYKDIFETFRQLFKNEWHRESAYRFRSHYNFQVIYLYQVFLQYATRHKNFPMELGGNGKAKYFKGKAFSPNRKVQTYSVKIYTGNISNKYIFYGKVTDDSENNKIIFDNIRKNRDILIFNLNDEYSEDYVSYEILEFLMEKYSEASEFEIKKYKNLEEEVQTQLKLINSMFNTKEKVSKLDEKSKSNKICKIIYNYKFSVLNDYLRKKRELAEPILSLSLREQKEINLLLKYNGEELENEWTWAKNVSIVYYFENSGDHYSQRLNALQLKNSILSIIKYLPWNIGTIYIITEKLIESELDWLKSNSIQSRIKIYSQNDILSKIIYQLNTLNNIKLKTNNTIIFNRNIIEMYLDQLPGISEHLIYMKSNYFFLKYIHPRFFFGQNGFSKYYFDKPLSKKEEDIIKIKDQPFYNSYELIRKYFGKYYIKVMRYLENTPFTCYRDLFDPVRKLYQIELNEYIIKLLCKNEINSILKSNIFQKNNQCSVVRDDNSNNSNNIIFLYLLANYNIYGTDHPFFPDFLVGFGKVRNLNIEKPKLNKNRTLDYYGFDISSPMITKATVLNVNKYSNNISLNNIIYLTLNHTNKLFFSLTIDNSEKLNENSINNLISIFNTLLKSKKKKK